MTRDDIFRQLGGQKVVGIDKVPELERDRYLLLH